MDPDPDEEATALVGDLVQAARVPAKRRPFPVKPTVERLTSLAYEHGLLPNTLSDLVDLVTTPGHLDQASLGALIRNLYPAGSAVPDHVVLCIVGCLGQGQLKPSLPIQALLLRWLVLVYHVLGNPTLLSRSYAVLFNLLDTAGIRPQVCHLLALITRRKHVRPFRIQAILNLSRQTGHDPHLIGLLRVFKNYYPEVIVGEATRGRASPFKHPDPQWRARLDEFRLSRRPGSTASGIVPEVPKNGFRVRQDTMFTQRANAGNSAIPSVHTSHAQEESVTLEEIESAEALVQNLEKIELPSQLVAVLADPLLQKLMMLWPADEAFRRVDSWMGACIASSASGDGKDGELMDLLEIVHDYVTSTKTFPPVLLRFFHTILSSWNGKDKKDLVLEGLSYISVSDFNETYKTTFAPLEAKLLDNSLESQLDLLGFYKLVLQHWATTLGATEDAEGAASQITAVTEFIQHVNGLVLAVLQNSVVSSSGSVSTLPALAVLDFYEEVTAILALGRHGILIQKVQEIVPPPEMVYTLHFGQSGAVLSRLYAVLAAYKRALEAAMTRRPNKQLTNHERSRVNLFNGFLMDVCNCVWRSRAFSATDTNAQGCRIPAVLVPRLASYIQGLDRELALTSAFSLSYSPTLCLYSISYLRELEDAAIEAGGNDTTVHRRHAGPVTQHSLHQLANNGGLNVSWQDYRSGLLVYLDQRGLAGVSDLMYNTMKNLMNARAGG